MVKTRKTKFKTIENEVLTMAMTMTKTIITKMFIITMIRMRINIGNRINI